MPPTPQEHSSSKDTVSPPESDAEEVRVFISGISGVFPEAHNVQELSHILYNKLNPIKEQQSRWEYRHPELPQYVGMAPDVDRFDAQFFSVHYRLGHHLDPLPRKILENTYQALYDAGLSPGHLDKFAAVFAGTSYSASERNGLLSMFTGGGLGLLGTNKAMFANRISYCLNLHGPSVSVDEGDSSATCALEQAYQAIKRGACDTAIVTGAHLCLNPQELIFHGRLSVISHNGETHSYSEDASGFALSDTAGVLVLQKSTVALRCYAELAHVKNIFTTLVSDEMGPRYGYYRNPLSTAQFIREFYKEARVDPREVEYVEGYGTGVPDVDKSELEAFEKAYCEDRADSLLVGSVTSNIGITEAASGVAALTKVLLGYYTGKLAANLHCTRPRQDIAAMREGRMRVVTEHQPFSRGYTAINGMSVTGANSHVLLKGQYKPKDLSRYKCMIPRLVLLSGRQDTAVKKIVNNLKSRPVDPEELALLHNIHSKNIAGHLGRGYIVLDTNPEGRTISLCEKAEYFDEAKRPLWLVYSGMGSQWGGMGAALMRISIFASTIQRCHQILLPKGLDLINIITTKDRTIFDNILHAFVGIAAIQIGLTDVLNELGLVPSGIIGHSVGELGCGYADGCLSAEETILAAWCRGQVSLQTKLIRGSMAAVGLGYKQISQLCPPAVDIACRNSAESTTISGPADVMQSFVAELTAKGVFAKEVPCANIAYHSRYIADAGPSLLKYLHEVIKNPKKRSERWVSTSVPQDDWSQEAAQYCSAEYQTNNLLSPVLFEETSRLIPHNAVVVEVAPHGLLQAILRRALPTSVTHVPLTKRGHADNVQHLLQAIGNLYMAGYIPNVQALYPKIEFPVSTETPMLSHLVEWVHTEKWNVRTYKNDIKHKTATCTFIKSTYDDEYKYLQGHVVQGKNCYPFAAALVAVWDTFAMTSGAPKRRVSVEFEDLHLHTQPLMMEQKPLKVDVAIHRGTGQFEVTNEFSKVISGTIIDRNKKALPNIDCDRTHENMEITSDDIYQLFRDRNYKYSGEFRSIDSASVTFKNAGIEWRENWVTLLDGMLQLNALRQQHRAVSLPTHVGHLYINVTEHYSHHVENKNGKNVLNATVNDVHDFIRCGGVLMRYIKNRNLPAIRQNLQVELFAPPTLNKQMDNLKPTPQKRASNTILCLQSAHIGKLDSLHWVQVPQHEHSRLNVQVHFAALNMLDVKRATGATPSDCNAYGMDYSGVTYSGERVMGIVAHGAVNSEVVARPELLWPVPSHWSLQEAATVPLAYAQAFYALSIKSTLRLHPGLRILVHGGLGALGQAAIAIALAHHCQVFTTVSDTRKKMFILRRFPQIKEEHIGNSRDISFYDQVMMATRGQGCDVILSCVRGELKDMSLKCCAPSGVVLDTVQIEDHEDFKYGMKFMMQARSYLTVDFASVFQENKYEEMKAIQLMLSTGISAGYVVPLSHTTYGSHETARAFHLLSTSHHRGRVLLRLRNNLTDVEQRLLCDPSKCHTVLWDSDTLGVQLVDGLIDRGVRKVYIYCTTLSSYLRLKLRIWQQLGVDIAISSVDLATTQHVENLLNDANKLGPVEGIYVLVTKENDGKFASVLQNIERVAKIYDKLRYFAIVSTVKDKGQDVCLSRVKHGSAATYLDLSGLTEEELWSGRAVPALTERALCGRHVTSLARRSDARAATLLEQIATLAGISIPQNVNKDMTLKQLGIVEEQARWIGEYLSFTYNVSLSSAISVSALTIHQINELEKCVTNIGSPDLKGLKGLFNYVDEDEIRGTTELVLLPTLSCEVLSLDDFALGERYLFIVPGMEGHHERFRELCERLKLPALVLQPELDHECDTVVEMAEKYAKILKTKAEVQNNFYILGYESGVLVALELAAMLEAEGYKGTVFCVGLAPNELKTELEEQLNEYLTEEQLQNAIVRHMCTLLTGEDTLQIDDELDNTDIWEEKVDIGVKRILRTAQHSAQYAKALIHTALTRIKQVMQFKPTLHALNSQLILLRAATNYAPRPKELQQYAEQPVIIHQVRSHLSTMLNDPQCASLINAYLDEEMQNTFNTKNLCHTYNMQEDLTEFTTK